MRTPWELQAFAVEFNSRLRVFKDSIDLIKKTENAKTFSGRIVDAVEHFNWMADKYSAGYPVKMEGTPAQARESLYSDINSNALRIALAIHAKYQFGKPTLTRKMAATRDLDLCLKSLRSAENFDEVEDTIMNMKDMINE